MQKYFHIIKIDKRETERLANYSLYPNLISLEVLAISLKTE